MNRRLLCLGIAVVVVTLAPVRAGPRAVSEDRSPKAEPVELSGRLHRPPKWSPQLDLGLSGHIRYFDLRGDLLKNVKEGNAIRVTGVVRTHYHRGGTPENPSPFPAQWMIWLEVTELEVLEDTEGGTQPGAAAERGPIPSAGSKGRPNDPSNGRSVEAERVSTSL
jgi:hypothetical protein